MTVAATETTHRSRIPSGYESYSAAGTPISYGGYNYIAQGNGTMLMLNPGLGLGYSSVRYQMPTGYGGLPVGSAINYGGANYVVNSGGTMSRVNPNAQPFRTGSTRVQPYRPNTVRTGPGSQFGPVYSAWIRQCDSSWSGSADSS